MTEILFGYGKTLDVDLSTGQVIEKYTDPQLARGFIGGMGFGSKILYDEVGPGVEPLGPENIIIFANGPLTGTHAPCAGRTEITTKSPLTGIIGSGNTGGVWGAMLKHAGFDLIIIRNQSEKPVYLSINDEQVEIREASHLWGKDTKVTSDIIRQELGSAFAVLAIGPAGENLVKFSCPVNEYHHSAARSGAGGVMGAKRLKAIAVRGTGTIRIADPQKFREAATETRERLMTAYRAIVAGAIGPDTRGEDIKLGCLPAKNFQTGFIPDFVETRGQEVAQKYITGKEGTCYACPISCFSITEVKEGKYAGTRVARGHHSGVTAAWGAKCAIDNLPAIWKCKELCQELGMDYGSTSGVIALAMELFQRGIITSRDTDGLELSWGNEDAVVPMLYKIAYREGFGNILAEGSIKAAARIGKGAERYVMTIKGMEMIGRDPRSCRRGFAMGEITSPRGGDNIKTTHGLTDQYNPNWWVDKFDMPDTVKKELYGMPPEELHSTWAGKPLMCRWFEDLYSVLNSLGLCFFQSGAFLAVGPTHLSKLYSACTGWDTTPTEIMMIGERVFNLLKAYNVRHSLARKDDDWPDRFYTEMLPEGPSKGAVLSRQEIDKVLEEYYELRGWDRRTGIPTGEKLTELGLNNIASDLQKLGS